MTWKAKENILWFDKGQEISDDEMQDNWKPHFEKVGDDPVVQDDSVVDFDVNNDGVVDEVDDSWMAKRLGSKGGRKSKGWKK